MTSSKISRRTLLGTGAALGVAPVVSQTSAALASEASSHCPTGPIAIDKVRDMFAFSKQGSKIPMNAANLCPSFECILGTEHSAARSVDLDVSFQNRAASVFPRLTETRTKIARQLSLTSACDLALVRNTSEGNNTVVHGMPLPAASKILLWNENHPTNFHSWYQRQQRELSLGRKMTIDCVRLNDIPPSRLDSELVLQRFGAALQRLKPNVLSFSHISNVSGIRIPATQLCRLARRLVPNIYIHVDGAMSWGSLAIDLPEMDCDSYASSAHKWFCGPRETGILHVRRERLQDEGKRQKFWPSVVAYDLYIKLPCQGDDPPPCSGAESDFGIPELRIFSGEACGFEGCDLWPHAKRFETLGQRDDAAIGALGRTVDLHDQIGPANIENHVRSLATDLKRRLIDLGKEIPGIDLVTPIDHEVSHGVVIAKMPQASRVYQELYSRFGIAGAPAGGKTPNALRLCPHMYNNVDDNKAAIDGIRAILNPR